MLKEDDVKHQKNLQDTLVQILDLLKKQELVSELVRKQDMPRHDLVQNLIEKQHLNELRKRLHQLHPADVAFILESLPLDQRQMVWDLVKIEHYGAILLEVSDAVRESLIEEMEHKELLDAAEHLESDEIADLVPDLPKDVVFELLTSLDSRNRAKVQSVLDFPEDTVGALMEFEMITVREDVTLEVVIRYLQRRGEIPAQTDQLFVVDRAGNLKGLLPLRNLLIHDPELLVSSVMIAQPISFHTTGSAREAAQAFERYDLLSAPVVNAHHQLVGCLSIDAVMDFINETSQKERLNQVGLSEEEDLFASVWKSAKNRWMWLAINLLTALLASRVIGFFESTIQQVVALATLMPIVAGIGGNTGNQTMALIIRGLALQQINTSNFSYLFYKEIAIALLNGILWGSVIGFVAYLLYQQISIGLVMTAAMVLNLLLASLTGVLIPLILHSTGRDPAMGSSVMLTAVTDSMGFFIFLGLASFFLL
jgi:magnesium transporter